MDLILSLGALTMLGLDLVEVVFVTVFAIIFGIVGIGVVAFGIVGFSEEWPWEHWTSWW